MSRVLAPSRHRRDERVRTRLRVRYGIGAIDRESFAESISAGGLYIATNDVFKVGTRLVLRIEFPERAVCHSGEVTWAIHVPDHLQDRMVCGMGVAFIDPDPQWQEFFLRWKTGVAGTDDRGEA
jgi:hypothetical protein